MPPLPMKTPGSRRVIQRRGLARATVKIRSSSPKSPKVVTVSEETPIVSNPNEKLPDTIENIVLPEGEEEEEISDPWDYVAVTMKDGLVMKLKTLPPLGGDFHVNAENRVPEISLRKPFIYGNTAEFLQEKRNDRTHKWSVYVKPYFNEDLTHIIKKVHFKLHESYNNHNRILTKMPYEVSETGWGEFEVVIKIFFNDPAEKFITLYHQLKLFHPGSDINDTVASETPVCSERLDTIIFNEPTQNMYELFRQPRTPCTDSLWTHHRNYSIELEKNLEKIRRMTESTKETTAKYTEMVQGAQGCLKSLKALVEKCNKGDVDGRESDPPIIVIDDDDDYEGERDYA